jgi:hypothetical protein
MKHILTILVPTFVVLAAMSLVVLVRTQSFSALRERFPRVVERLPEIIEEVLE